MPVPELTRRHYGTQLRLAEAAKLLARRQWARIGQDLDAGWSAISGPLTLLVANAQLGAARAGAQYVPDALRELGQQVTPDAPLLPAAWSGVASDGRPLQSLLFGAVVDTRSALSQGAGYAQALDLGRRQLDALVVTQVADAGRGATGAAIAARRDIGYVRMVSAPCCQRCAVLAGKWFRWNDGFLRHKRCRCRHVPCRERGSDQYTAAVPPDQIRDLNQAQRLAIADGSDVNQVINAYRSGARSNGGMVTSEGITRRGVYGGYRRNTDGTLTKLRDGQQAAARLTPEAIYRLAATREEALNLLIKYGYLR